MTPPKAFIARCSSPACSCAAAIRSSSFIWSASIWAGGTTMPMSMEIRSAILEKSGIRDDQLLTHMGHTHSGPITNLQNLERQGGHLIPPYREKIVEGAVAVINESKANAQPAVASWADGPLQPGAQPRPGAGQRDLPLQRQSRWPQRRHGAGGPRHRHARARSSPPWSTMPAIRCRWAAATS